MCIRDRYIERDEFDALKKQIDDLKREFEKQYEVKAKEELAKIEVESEPVYHSPEIKSKKVQMLSQNRPLSTQDIVFKKLFS